MSTTTVSPNAQSPATTLDLAEVQGNILAGFNKDHQCFCFLRIDDAAKVKLWLTTQIPHVSNSAVVKLSNDQRKVDLSNGKTPSNAHWLNIAFNYPGLGKLGAQHTSKFPNDFKEGMASRSKHLGDVGANSPDQWDPWLRSRDSLDILVLLAADDPSDRDAAFRG